MLPPAAMAASVIVKRLVEFGVPVAEGDGMEDVLNKVALEEDVPNEDSDTAGLVLEDTMVKPDVEPEVSIAVSAAKTVLDFATEEVGVGVEAVASVGGSVEATVDAVEGIGEDIVRANVGAASAVAVPDKENVRVFLLKFELNVIATGDSTPNTSPRPPVCDITSCAWHATRNPV